MLPRMSRHFNVGGVNNPRDHYTLPPLRRLPGVHALVDGKQYFVVHAPRQVGKTTAFRTLAQELTAAGTYAAVLVSVETAVPFRDKVGMAEATILGSWSSSAHARLPREFQPPPWPDAPEGSRIRTALQAWAEACSRPLVVFVDEIDALEGETLLSILRQIRDGHADLHRVVNGGGTIEREYAIGRGRMDLHVCKGEDRFAVEIKVWRADGDVDPLGAGLEQIEEYLSGLNLDTGWLVIFDRRPSAPPLSQRFGASPATTPRGKVVVVIRA